jgi:hypothetical protein
MPRISETEARRNARIRFGNPVVWSGRVNEFALSIFVRNIAEDLRFGGMQECVSTNAARR